MQYKIVPVTPFEQNCSVLWCQESKRGAVVDPGGDTDKILAVIRAEDIKVEKILLTHAHIDHVGAAEALARRLDVPMYGPHLADKFWIDALPTQAEMFGFPSVAPFQPQQWLNQGDRICVGELTLEVRHCPGHTPGHVVFLHMPSKIAIVGDVLFRESIGRTDFPQGNHQELINSIQRELLTLDDTFAFIPGHGPMSTIGHERQYNPFVSGKWG